METVEERAEEYAKRNFSQTDMSIQLAAGAGYQAGYKAGASTQRIIEQEVRLKKREDVTQGEYDRQNSFFMDWYLKRKETPTYSDAIEWTRKKVIDEACNIFCHTGCPHKTDSYNCLKDKCDALKAFKRMMLE